MFIYRIEKAQYKDLFPPRGSLFAEGRWNRKGMWVVYASETVALAKLEALANSGSKLPEHRHLSIIELKDNAPVVQISEKDLPGDWNRVPFRKSLAAYVDQIIDSKSFVAALVPSIHSPVEHNVLLFPDYPDFDQFVKLISSEPLGFDNRLK